MTKINHEEYEILKGLEDKWKWIARDSNSGNDGRAYAYLEKPFKRDRVGIWSCGKGVHLINVQSFQFIQWEDEEPYSIVKLIKDYEFGKILLAMAEEETVLELGCESEEAEMKKDIEWLKEEVLELKSNSNYEANQTEVEKEIGRLQQWAWNNCVDRVYDLLNQLDEPEVLPEEITEENGMSESEWAEVIDRYKWHLEQEGYVVIEKPTIPEFVIGFLDEKEEYALHELLDNDFIYESHDELARWLYDNDEKTNKEREINLVLAQRYGYTVKEEPLYRARLKVITNEFVASYLRTQSSDAEDRLKALEVGSKYIHEDYRHLSEFTEDELKRLDIWDSEQWEIEKVEENGLN